MGLSPILSVVHTVAIGTILNFNDGNKAHGLRTLNVNHNEHTCNWLVSNSYRFLHTNT